MLSIVVLAVWLSCARASAADVAPAGANKQTVFATPDDAFHALLGGLEKNSDDQLLDVLGHAHTDLVVQSDKGASAETRARLFTLAKEHMKIVVDGDKATACFGLKCWPYPIPVAKAADGWRFDTAAGKEEILNRRIGRDELAVLKFMDGYDNAQRAYAGADHTGDKVLKYAQKPISSPGKQDGLYWPVPVGPNATPSPLAGIAEDSEDFLAGGNVPYHGYYVKILTKQGANAPNGKYDYVINGNMIAGFALAAWPADYGSSGVMTFVVSHQGTVYEKNLGPDTAKLAGAIDEYNPDATWKEVKPEEK
jgi:hypothetical protein